MHVEQHYPIHAVSDTKMRPACARGSSLPVRKAPALLPTTPPQMATLQRGHHYEDENRGTKGSIVDFFDAPPSAVVLHLCSFRALCNGIKAALIEGAIAALRAKLQVSHLSVLDLGSGKGGDLAKWSRHRPRRFIGVDVSSESVREAEQRHMSLLRDGRLSTSAIFHCLDASKEKLPCEDGSISIASAQFSLQFFFSDEASISHVLSEAARVLCPGGVFVAMLPDGDRIVSAMQKRGAAGVAAAGRWAARREAAGGSSSSIVMGHFLFRQFEKTSKSLSNDPPLGIPYSFSLAGAPSCLEYVVFSSYLGSLLERYGFEGCLPGSTSSQDAQHYYAQSQRVRDIVAALMRGRWCSGADWESLLSFRVVLARKKLLCEEPSSSAPAAATVVASFDDNDAGAAVRRRPTATRGATTRPTKKRGRGGTT